MCAECLGKKITLSGHEIQSAMSAASRPTTNKGTLKHKTEGQIQLQVLTTYKIIYQ
jgi:hypothetical protein